MLEVEFFPNFDTVPIFLVFLEMVRRIVGVPSFPLVLTLYY